MSEHAIEFTTGCGETIEEGDPIGRVDGEWMCEDCVDDAGGEDYDD